MYGTILKIVQPVIIALLIEVATNCRLDFDIEVKIDVRFTNVKDT